MYHKYFSGGFTKWIVRDIRCYMKLMKIKGREMEARLKGKKDMGEKEREEGMLR